MRNITFLLLLFASVLVSCGQSQNDGRIIEMQEVSQGKFVVQDERDSGENQSWVVVHYLNGSQKTIGLSEAEQLMNQAPPSPPNSPVFVNYDGGHSRGGITFSDLLLYHMMFNGFGGSHYHTQIVHRYPVYHTTIHRTVNVNYSSRYRQRWANAPFYRSSHTVRTYANRSTARPVYRTSSFASGSRKYVPRPSQVSRPAYSPPRPTVSNVSRPSYSSSSPRVSRSSSRNYILKNANYKKPKNAL